MADADVCARGGHLSISKEDVDVILCSDCIYDEDLVESLAKTIAALARPDTGSIIQRLHDCFDFSQQDNLQRYTWPTSIAGRQCSSSFWIVPRHAGSRR